MSTQTESIVSLWGGEKTLGRQIRSENDLIEALRQGLPYAALERLMETVKLSRSEVASALLIPGRTLVRRKQEQRLAVDESDRLYRLARIVAHALAIFGDREKVAAWLHRPNRALDGAIPLGLLDTDIGATRVDDVLGRLEHGVFS
jgi:putative toxin-antitoxin system antitoxin component (TIGR02293 family)